MQSLVILTHKNYFNVLVKYTHCSESSNFYYESGELENTLTLLTNFLINVALILVFYLLSYSKFSVCTYVLMHINLVCILKPEIISFNKSLL